MNEIDVFHFDENKDNFDDLGKDNGFRYWFARDLMKFLGYDSFNSFHKSINKAMTSCMTTGINVSDNFIQEKRCIDGKDVNDYRLSKFACYLVTMNGDTKKPQVAKAQAYFAAITDAFQKYIKEVEDVERVYIREEVSEHEKSLAGIANSAGITNYPFFQNSGYLGMYNMNLSELKRLKGIDKKRTPLDFMGKRELAANLFRITETEATIENQGIRGQKNLENTAYKVGKSVRETMVNHTGTYPEDIPISEDIKNVKKDLKQTQKELKKIDKKV